VVQKWRNLPILPIDRIRGFSPDSCFKSDDLVMSAALQSTGVRRYRMTLNDDCREVFSYICFVIFILIAFYILML